MGIANLPISLTTGNRRFNLKGVVIQATVLFLASLMLPFSVSASSMPPLPLDINIEPPAPDLPNEIKGLSGYWEGTWIKQQDIAGSSPLHERNKAFWNNTVTLNTILVVEKVDNDYATIIYAVDDCPGWHIVKGWRRYHATITSKKGKSGFSFNFGGSGRLGPIGSLTFLFNKGNLEGESSIDYNLEIKMARKETAFARHLTAVKGRTPEPPSRSPGPAINRHREQALAYVKKGQYDEALAEFTRVLGIDPKDAETHNNRGSIYTLKGQYDQAIADFSKALELNSRYAQAYYNRGLVYFYQNAFDQAIADLNKAIELKPNDAAAYNNRGLAFIQKGMHDRAINDFNMAIVLKRDLADAYFNKAVTCEKAGRREEAREAYEAFLKHAPPEAKSQIEQAKRRLEE